MTARLVALDLDGTLMGPDLSIRPAVHRSVARAVAEDVAVVVATGRLYPSAAEHQARLGVTGPLICAQGAVVRGDDGAVWLNATLAPDIVAEAARFAADRGDELTAFGDDHVMVADLARDGEFFEHWFGLPRRPVGDLAGLTAPVTKFIVVAADAGHGDRIEVAWRARFEPRLTVVRSHPLFVEGVPRGASKGRALAHVAERLDVRRAHTVAVGDADNDRSMLEWAGVGVAMGGAAAEVRAAADHVAPPLDEDGAAWAIERFVLGAAARDRGTP